MTITHILDTSALLAHYFDEPGADEVEQIWRSGTARPAVCAITVAEMRSRLEEEIADRAEVSSALSAYLDELTTCVPVDRSVAEAATHIRATASERVPLIDALIAGCARCHDAILVHRDRHMAVIPPNLNRRSLDGLNHTTTGLSPDRLGEGLHSLAFVHAHAV